MNRIVIYMLKKEGPPQTYLFDGRDDADAAFKRLQKRIGRHGNLGVAMEAIQTDGGLRPIMFVCKAGDEAGDIFFERIDEFRKAWNERQD